MPFIPLAINTTLADFEAGIRKKRGALSEQESQLFTKQLGRVIYRALASIRKRYAPELNDKYWTDETVTESSNLINISALDVYDFTTVELSDSTHGPFIFVGENEFSNLTTIYSAAQLANAMFAEISNISSGGNNAQHVRTYRGTNKTTPGTLTFSYCRNVKKPTSASEKLDLPEEFIPLAEDLAAVMLGSRDGEQIQNLKDTKLQD